MSFSSAMAIGHKEEGKGCYRRELAGRREKGPGAQESSLTRRTLLWSGGWSRHRRLVRKERVAEREVEAGCGWVLRGKPSAKTKTNRLKGIKGRDVPAAAVRRGRQA
jgi:hypothetical protein